MQPRNDPQQQGGPNRNIQPPPPTRAIAVILCLLHSREEDFHVPWVGGVEQELLRELAHGPDVAVQRDEVDFHFEDEGVGRLWAAAEDEGWAVEVAEHDFYHGGRESWDVDRAFVVVLGVSVTCTVGK